MFFPHPVPVAPDRERYARCVLADELGLGAGGLATEPLVGAVRTVANAVAPAENLTQNKKNKSTYIAVKICLPS